MKSIAVAIAPTSKDTTNGIGWNGSFRTYMNVVVNGNMFEWKDVVLVQIAGVSIGRAGLKLVWTVKLYFVGLLK